MQSLHYILVEVDKSYNNELQIGDTTLITNTTIESVANINRVAKVVSAPEGTLLLPGDEIIFHHNILRTVYGYRGEKKFSDYWVKDNIYFIPPTEIFAFKRNGAWNAVSPFCFVKPFKATQDSLLLQDKADYSHQGNERLQGFIWLSNSQLEEQGVKVGDKVLFSPFSEYVFEIEGEEYYKMSTNDILAKL